jgi:hypothetical protein
MKTRAKGDSRHQAEARAQRVLADSGASEERFGEPRGWALKWDGPSLPEDREVKEGGSRSPSESAL